VSAPDAPATFTFYQDAEDGWWWFMIRYGRSAAPEHAGGVPLPSGLSFAETREATRARLGPEYRAAMVPVDRWELGPIGVLVRFGEDELPSYMEFWPQTIARRS
jgi:hypothetical protein